MDLSRLLVAFTFVFLLAFPLGAQGEEISPLLALLAHIPDTPAYREFVAYGDLALWNESWAIDRITSVSDLHQRSDRDDPSVPATLFVMTRQTSAPQALDPSYLAADELRGYAGMDLLNTDRYLEAGNPPAILTIIETAADTATIARLLAASGHYDETTIGNARLFSHGDDFSIHMNVPDMPMGARLGALNRVALVADRVLVARATSVIERALAAVSGAQPSLADNPAFRAGTLAVSDPSYAGDGALVGAMFIAPAAPWDMATMLGPAAQPELVESLEAALDVGSPLPAYELMLFASRRRADDSQMLLALVLDEGADAQAATETLLMRVKRYDSLRTGQPIIDLWAERGVEIEWGRGFEIEGRPVSLVSLSVRNPTLRPGTDGRVDTYIFQWADMVYTRDLGFLAHTN